jgi:potassium/chloride transporter 9
MTFLVTNLACLLLKAGSAPNFRPSFHFFNLQTAAVGTVACGVAMFYVDGFYASACVALLMAVFLLIHYTTPPKPYVGSMYELHVRHTLTSYITSRWGDVSQGLIYHQVRKYLLRLKQEHVKFWRPQILLLVNDPRRQYKLIQFCNSLKKGGLFVLGHVIVTQNFGEAVAEARRQQQSWTRYIDFSRIKAFVSVTISPAVEWGARNLVLGAGLGGMRPNIVMMGFYNLPELRHAQPNNHIPSPQPSRPSSKATNHSTSRKAIQAYAKRRQTSNMQGMLPTDAMRPEDAISIKSYVTIIEDLVLRMQANLAVAKGFQELEVPSATLSTSKRALNLVGMADIEFVEPSKTYIDLWPIQMSAEMAAPGEEPNRKNVLTTNFDTYTLILQLGCILHTVSSWKRTYKIRVCVFVEYESDVEEERERVTTLLRNLRIQANVLVFWLASGDLKMYEVIVNGKDDGDLDETAKDIDYSLEDERWWQDIKRLRQPVDMSASQELAQATDLLEAITQWPSATFQYGRRETRPKRFSALQRMLLKAKRRANSGDVRDSESLKSSNGDEDDADDEAMGSESEAAISGSNFDEYDLDVSSEENDGGRSSRAGMSSRRAKTTTTGERSSFFIRKLDLRRALWKGSQSSPKVNLAENERPTSGTATPSKPHSDAAAPDIAILRAVGTRSVASSSSRHSTSSRGRVMPAVDDHSQPKFTSKTLPRTAVASNEAPGPSIMFVDTPSPATAKKTDPMVEAYPGASQSDIAQASPIRVSAMNSPVPSANATNLPPVSPYTSSPASGFPAQQAIPLSFNDLPCRAQHLILNELMRQQSEDTAVVFTTLPSPMEGTCDSESESVKYISDLEVLCEGLPPILLVHSNSMTVTMNL